MLDLAFNPNKKPTKPTDEQQVKEQEELNKKLEEMNKNFLQQFNLNDTDVKLDLYDASQHINKEELEKLQHKLDERVDITYKSVDNISVKNNIEQFSRLTEQMIIECEDHEQLELIRFFPKGFLANRGIFYSYSKENLIENFPYLLNSSLYQTVTEDDYYHRFMLPIRLPNGDTINHMGYRATYENIIGPKYSMPYYEWMSQGSIIGNMESLKLYPNSKDLYVVEGMMDAYRVNQVLESPCIAMLGSKLTTEKRIILELLKQDGYKLILVPDQDESGMKDTLMNNKLFDNILLYGDSNNDKDFDIFCGQMYIEYIKEKYQDDQYMLDKATLFDLTDEEIKQVNLKIKSKLLYKNPINMVMPSRVGIQAFL